MARKRESGLNVSRKRLADGTVREYFYDRRTGAPLGTDREAAALRVAEDAASATASALPPGSLAALIVEYLGTPEYRRLAPRTQKLYRGYLDAMRRDFGDLPIRGIRPSTIERIKLANESQPRKANQIVALFRILLGMAVRRDYLDSNPALRPGRLPTTPRSEVWSTAEEDAFLAAARPSLRLAGMLLLYTLQRPGDVLAMTKGQVSERGGRMFIRLRQEKTGTLLDVPVHNRLAPLLASRTDETTGGMLLVPSPTGLPWAYRNFARAWDAAVATAGVEHRQRRDLRRTGIVRLAEAGATTPQIAALSGHGIDYCQRIIDTYLPRRTEVALGGIEQWERAPASEVGNVVHIGRRGS